VRVFYKAKLSKSRCAPIAPTKWRFADEIGEHYVEIEYTGSIVVGLQRWRRGVVHAVTFAYISCTGEFQGSFSAGILKYLLQKLLIMNINIYY